MADHYFTGNCAKLASCRYEEKMSGRVWRMEKAKRW